MTTVPEFINPTVDCVFKAILGSESHKFLLIHFLNAVLELPQSQKVTDLDIRNPFNTKKLLHSKGSVLDIRACDQSGREFQIELQVCNHPALAQRIMFNWAQLYADRLKKGEDYGLLQPVISIWLMSGALFSEVPHSHLEFGLYCCHSGVKLTADCAIHVMQLANLASGVTIEDDKRRWLTFFKEARYFNPQQLPQWMNTREMRAVMQILKRFTEDEEQADIYRCQLEAQRIEATNQRVMKQALAEAAEARAQIQQLQAEKQRERAEKKQLEERYQALLKLIGHRTDGSD